MTIDPLDAQLAEDARIEAAMTPGPWVELGGRNIYAVRDALPEPLDIGLVLDDRFGLCHIRNRFPELLALVAKLRAEVEAASEQYDSACFTHGKLMGEASALRATVARLTKRNAKLEVRYRCPSCGGDGVECCRRPPCGGCGCLAHDGGTCFTGAARDAIFGAEQRGTVDDTYARRVAMEALRRHGTRYTDGSLEGIVDRAIERVKMDGT